MKREYPEQPIVSVGGIILKSQSVLLVKRNQDPGKGEWSLPGGAVELGETLHEALVREILEETSVEIKIGGLVRIIERISHNDKGDVRFHYVIADYWGWPVMDRSRAGSDVSDALFWELSTLGDAKVSKEVADTISMAVEMKDKYFMNLLK